MPLAETGADAATDAGETAPAEEAPPEEAVEVIEGSQGLKDAVSEKSETAAGILESLDSLAFEIGNLRISMLDTLLIFGVIFLVITVAWIATRLSRSLIKRITRFDSTQKLLAEKLSTVAIWALAFLIGIDLLGIDLTALAFFGGAFGLAIGFGLQKTFGNLISGILLLLDKSIKPGDVISVTDQAGNEATATQRIEIVDTTAPELTVMGGLTVLLWGMVNRPDIEPPWPAKVAGFSFSPMRGEQSPDGAEYRGIDREGREKRRIEIDAGNIPEQRRPREGRRDHP